MNYQKIYDQLIERARFRKLKKYKERHHIIPICLGGINEKINIVELTSREHFLCHWLLHEIHPKNAKLLYAFSMMCKIKSNNQKRYTPSSRIIEYAKLMYIQNHPAKTNDSKIKLSKKRSGKTWEELFGKDTSDRMKKERSINMKVKNPMCDKENNIDFKGINNPFYGKKHNEATKQLLKRKRKKSEIKRVYSIIECPYCKKQGGSPNMTRYHFNNCKQK